MSGLFGLDDKMISIFITIISLSVLFSIIISSAVYWKFRNGIAFKLVLAMLIVSDYTGMTITITGFMIYVDSPYRLVVSTVIMFIGLIVFSGIIYKIFVQIILPLNQLSTFSKEISEGNLTVDIPRYENKDLEINLLFSSFRSMVISLREIIDAVNESISEMTSNAEELASSTEEVTSLSEEITATTQQISKAASSQSNYTAKAINDIKDMSDKINLTLKDINNVVAIIEEIASQTNILALNAAIEAARAGEYGRGFAVVADNVRRLAEETKENITGIVELNSKINENLINSAKELMETLQDLASRSEEFSASSEEVAASTEEQTTAMTELSKMADQLNIIGQRLSNTITMFRV